MPRNLARDAQEMERRKNQLIQAGFELFSRKGIENVSLQVVAETADVGIATVYNYYQNKVNLVVAISTKIWTEVWKNEIQQVGVEKSRELNAYEAIEFYADTMIRLYQNRPEVLCFSSNYKTYICREDAPEESISAHIDALAPIEKLFRERYERAKTDGSIRTDIPVEDMFSTVTLTMLGMAERYAQSLVWAKKDDRDYVRELQYTKDMLLAWVSKK